jgi:hypothetical protein
MKSMQPSELVIDTHPCWPFSTCILKSSGSSGVQPALSLQRSYRRQVVERLGSAVAKPPRRRGQPHISAPRSFRDRSTFCGHRSLDVLFPRVHRVHEHVFAKPGVAPQRDHHMDRAHLDSGFVPHLTSGLEQASGESAHCSQSRVNHKNYSGYCIRALGAGAYAEYDRISHIHHNP